MKPWLLLPPKLTHDLAPIGLQFLAAFREPTSYPWRELNWRGMNFKNRLGLAGGFDKNAESVEDWWKFGAGFIEVGTVTPESQIANPGKILDRDYKSESVWNRMGFPSAGAWSVRENLNDLPSPRYTPVFINIGKNRATTNSTAVQDYANCIDVMSGLADAWVINISSPNTTGLRELLQPLHLRGFLSGVLTARKQIESRQTPVLLKLSPDLEDADLRSVVEISAELGIDGYIATNTTLAREFGSPFPVEGGVSGRPLAARSKATLQVLIKTLGQERKDRLIVSVGGVMSADDVRERLDLGADLVQVYSALVFNGPGFFAQVAAQMAAKDSAF